MPAADAEEKCLFYLNLSAEQTIIIFKLCRPRPPTKTSLRFSRIFRAGVHDRKSLFKTER